MCIIAIKQKGTKFPSIQRVKTMCENNSDGFAIVWHHPTVGCKVYRTLSEDKFIQEYTKIMQLGKKKTSLFIHARIKTHGTMKLENCHGWVSEECGLAFAHNGILTGVANRDDMTDSETFFRDIFVPSFMYGGWEGAEKAIKAIIGTSKFVFMDGLGNIAYYGQYLQGDEGVLYSNSTYEPYYYPYRTIKKSTWKGNKSANKPTYTRDVWDEEDRDFDYNQYNYLFD